MTRSAIFSSISLFVLAYCFVGVSEASVSLKNGNFFVGYTDIVYPGGFEPKIERVYNSKTPYKGIFGWGWGTEHEVFLTVSADGSVVVHEFGGGAENRFTPKAFNSSELNAAVDQLMGVAQKIGIVGSKTEMERYRQKLLSDATFRNDEWQKFVNQRRIQPRQLKEGTRLYSNRFSYQYITKTNEGYLRTFDSGKNEQFDESGRLSRVSDKNKNFINFTYGKDGKLEKMVDNFNRKIFFKFDKNGLLTSLQGENGKEASYEYNAQNELVTSKDVDGNQYTFKYDQSGRHNLVEIGYSDNTSMKISYYPRDKNEHVQSVQDRDGTITTYNYNESGNNFSVAVNVKDRDGKSISKSSYKYEFGKFKDGSEWTRRLTTNIDGDQTQTTYNECCGLPIRIQRGKDLTLFEYDSKGHVVKKTTPTEVTQLTYDAAVGKVKQVIRYPKNKKRKPIWSKFKYDSKGNLIFAKNSTGKGVNLVYDRNGRIHTMIDQNKRKITFKYNENSKPIEISDPAVGTITVSYTNSGEIKKVDSTAGRKIALQVTSAFQNLLEIIRPAGVTLSF